MKFCFSTVGCPGWTFDEIYSTASDLGYDGIEIRGMGSQMYAPSLNIFSDSQIEKTKETLKRLNLEIAILTSNACVANPECKNAIEEAKDYIDLANKLNVKYVRIMCTNSPNNRDGDYDLAVSRFREICEYGDKKNVMPLIETNGMFCDTKLLKKFIIEVNHKNSGILWDLHHPYRFEGEQIMQTIENIGAYIKHVHIKDSKLVDGQVKYKLLGNGDMPIKDAIEGLKVIRYDDYISLEWVKRWNRDLEEPGVVFAQFISYMKKI